MITEAIILAGGKGTRLQEVVNDVPKPMAEINGKPFLSYQFDYLIRNNIKRVILSVGYKYELIKEFYGNNYKSLDIEYAIEEEALGTGGAIKYAFEKINSDQAFVFNGDTMFDIDLNSFNEQFISGNYTVGLALRHISDVSRYGSVELESNRITEFIEKGIKTGEGLINGGVYLINKSFFNLVPFPEKFSMEKDGFEKLYKKEPLFAMTFNNYFIDIGIPTDYYKAADDFKQNGY